ncbi:MAG: hypothetical protein AVDCRST_MAG30-1331 [uncultured Solirubrobacteraceae bacterium]|uniref:Uncharacterized protein n=1 Tax=uncultured Solirubrobacteraceae bacterium TaxID=1162706 RepID=A0A6J4S6C2_9ACTN|nr:MAG: hypothetical protein AVDCRST_MAG30-1331 [uncultured Solirubrobacteraceae bacterium]
MAPATFAGASPQVREGRGGWDRDSIVNAIREWVATYGEPPRAADWNPSSAKWSGQLWRVERYRAGRADGSPWPALNSAKRPFGGSLTEAVRAAGFEPARPGPKRRTDVDPEQAGRAVISPEGRAMIDAALARAREAERRAAAVESRLERALERASRIAAERDRARRTVRPAKVVRERVVDPAAVARATRRADAAAAKAGEREAEARMDAAEARGTAKRLAARLERSEATVGTLRGERRELKAEADGLADRLVALERTLESTRAQAEAGRRAPEVVTVREEAPEAAEVRAAAVEAARCRRIAEDAELRAARAERELRETVAAIRGEERKLTPAELAELKTQGPGGPAVMAEALKALTAARGSGNPTRMRDALRRVAQAAVTWQERI